MLSVLAYNASLSLAVAALLWAAYSDARTFRIPNAACLALFVLYVPYAALSPTPVRWQADVFIFGGVLLIGYLIYLKNLAGAGDIKLLAVVSLWAGLAHIAEFIVITAFAGGILSAGLLALAAVKQRLSKEEKKVSILSTPIPYGIAIALGGLGVLFLLSHAGLSSGKV
ncbi:MAG: prepilin peptidase [Alphaproteobacteria bacterium]|nr:prepilin peptidase [Alphaproteobacteria bacterium]